MLDDVVNNESLAESAGKVEIQLRLRKSLEIVQTLPAVQSYRVTHLTANLFCQLGASNPYRNRLPSESISTSLPSCKQKLSRRASGHSN